jgi:hypothetical protein
MKKLKYTKKLTTDTMAFVALVNNYCDKVNKEYSKNMNKLINDIALGENLDPVKLKEKYLKSHNSISSEQTYSDESILDKIIIDNITYYVEDQPDGKVYDSNSVVVGKYTNKIVVLNV